MITLEEFTDKYLWELIDYDWVWGSQCTDLLKAYTNEVLNVRLWSFGGSARSGWSNVNNTFPANDWEKVVNDYNQPFQTPKEWDLIFWDSWNYWHCAISTIDNAWNTITMLEQNVWNWDWYWEDDATQLNIWNYNQILGWYKYKWNNQNTESEELKKENKILKEKLDKIKLTAEY